MSKVYDRVDGVFPKPNTKVRVIDTDSAYYKKGDIVYVTTYPHSSDRGLVVNERKDQHHGSWICKWEIVGTIEELTDDQKEEISRLALDAAKKRGYCDETTKILEDLGFPSSPREERSITYTARPGDKVVLTINGDIEQEITL